MAFRPQLVATRITWVVPQRALVPGKIAPVDTRWPDLTDQTTAIGTIGGAMNGAGDFVPPWNNPAKTTHPGRFPGDHFWRLYHELNVGQPIEPREAWRRLVPLKYAGADPVKMTNAVPGLKVGLETFVYPHGTAVVAGLFLRSNSHSLRDAVDAIATGSSGMWSVTWDSRRPVELQNLTQVVRKIVGTVEAHRLADRDIDDAMPYPFVVSAVVQAAGTSPGVYPEPESELHGCLEGLASVRADWAERRPAKLETAILDSGSKDGFTYAIDNGRTIWKPAKALETDNPPQNLGCYSRNMTRLSMQTDALVRYVSSALKSNEVAPLPVSRRKVVRQVVSLLGRLHHRGDDPKDSRGSYHSVSTPRRLADLGAFSLVREGCETFGRPIPDGWPAA